MDQIFKRNTLLPATPLVAMIRAIHRNRWGGILAVAMLMGCIEMTAQPQIDFRGQMSLMLEKKVTPYWSATLMGAGQLTYDFQELGFAYVDAGLKYKLNRNFGVNANYRRFYNRNLDNFYNTWQFLYADLDFAKKRNSWTLGGTERIQCLFFRHLFESEFRRPLVYSRTRINLRYKVNYFWQTFAEAELFIPLNRPDRQRPDQWRSSLGFAYSFNRNVRVEVYGQLQRRINVAIKNTNFLTAINWFIRI